MFTRIFPNFQLVTARLATAMYDLGYTVSNAKWQGIENDKPFLELSNIAFSVPMREWETILPNQPWVETHYQERIGGIPLNPGESYKSWPYYGSDNKMRTEGEQFTHTYMERFWPKFAGKESDREMAIMKGDTGNIFGLDSLGIRKGIRYEYGDLQDVINLLKKDPKTRQAYLPIFFPEDTGCVHGGRIPCSIGYHFIQRNGHLHCIYQLRSCDFIRHFQDDMWLACRLTMDILRILQEEEVPGWKSIAIGMLTMHITSLHIFAQEKNHLKKYYEQAG